MSNRQAVTFEFSPLIGIAAAALLGGAIGIQRQAWAKPAGFRTHLLVATGAAAFTAMGAHLHDTRIPSYIVVGIGFLGSGAIVRQGTTSVGLTTAASIWMSAAIGLALGYSNGFGLSVGLLATLITLIGLNLSDSALLNFLRIPRRAVIRITSTSPPASGLGIASVFQAAGIPFESDDLLAVTKEGGAEVIEMTYVVELKRGHDLNALIRDLAIHPGVRKVEAREPFFGT